MLKSPYYIYSLGIDQVDLPGDMEGNFIFAKSNYFDLEKTNSVFCDNNSENSSVL